MSNGTQKILESFVNIIAPLNEAVSSADNFQLFLRNLGYKIDQVDLLFESVDVFENLASTTEQIIALGEQAGQSEGGFGVDDWPVVLAAVKLVSDTIQSVQDIADALSVMEDIAAPLNEAEFWQGLAEDIPSYLIVSFLKWEHKGMYATLKLIGLIDDMPGRTHSFLPTRTSLVWDRFASIITDPSSTIAESYEWNEEDKDFDYTQFIHNLGLLGSVLKVPSSYTAINNTIADDLYPGQTLPTTLHGLSVPIMQGKSANDNAFYEVGIQIVPLPKDMEDVETATAITLGGFAILPYANGEVDISEPVGGSESLSANAVVEGDLTGGVRLQFHPDGIQFVTGEETSAFSGSAKLELVKSGAGESGRIVLLGSEDSTSLSIESIVAALGFEEDDFYIAGGVKDVTLKIDVGEDGLLSYLIPEAIEASGGDIVAGWRQNKGFYVEQSGGLSLYIPLDIEVGPVRLHELGLELTLSPDIRFTGWMSGDVTIGPLFLGVEGVGLNIDFIPSEDDSSFRSFELKLSPKFPTGYIAALDAGVVSGGGALIKEDYDYKGALSLKFQNFGLSAYGILSTRMPDGEKGFSFVSSIFGEFSVALGYGFFLTGVGGIIGIHRTTDIEAIREVLSEGRLDSILFPDDPITDATVILDDLEDAFPVQEGQHLFGPMARIGWGIPTLIEGKLGVIIELGNSVRLLILGSIGASLPTKEAAVVSLYIDFLGSIDFDTGEIGFDAAISNSRILTWPISGEAAIRTGWGENAGLVAAVGGLHPQYPNPSGFPSLERICISFGGDNPRLSLTAYQAITTNSVQMGAEASLYVNAGKIPLVGKVEVEGWAGFNALIIFNPFSFDADLSLGLQLLVDGDVICGIGGDLRLKGPNVFYIKGKVWVTVFGIDIKVEVEYSWGSNTADNVNRVNALTELEQALAAIETFESVSVSNRSTGVTFKTNASESGIAVIDPTGGIRVLQSAMPLGVEIEKIGTSELRDNINKVDLEVTYLDGSDTETDTAKTEFSRAHFYEMTDQEKLRSPAFEKHKAGAELTDDAGFIYDANATDEIDDDYEYVEIKDDEALLVQGLHRTTLTDILNRSYTCGVAPSLATASKNLVNKNTPGIKSLSFITDPVTVANTNNSATQSTVTAGYIMESIFGAA